jgi:DNA polymerase III delta prime subunit
MNKESIPWVEKYRPINFDNIVLNEYNKKILFNIIDTNYFPNLLFYGPPGTGKTTTIINLIKKYQKTYNQSFKDLVIHLNASDERGIDIIRNQINQFVNSKNLFNTGLKFIILDEVDYMTKNAQQALKYLLQSYSNNIRFCLICNYISKIDNSLQNEFMCLCFNQLPQKKIIEFIQNMIDQEKIIIEHSKLVLIQELFNSDIRSMINFIQINQANHTNINIINNDIYDKIIFELKTNNILQIKKYICKLSIEYNIDIKNIIINLCNYIIVNKLELVTDKLLNCMENIIHYPECDINLYINYIIHNLNILIK